LSRVSSCKITTSCAYCKYYIPYIWFCEDSFFNWMVQNIDYVLASRELNVQCHWIYTSEFHRQLLLFTWSWILRIYSENIHWLSLAVGFYISGSLNQGLIHTSRFFSWKPVSCHYFSIYIQTPFYSTSTIYIAIALIINFEKMNWLLHYNLYLPSRGFDVNS